jgi:hypothetical protein
MDDSFAEEEKSLVVDLVDPIAIFAKENPALKVRCPNRNRFVLPQFLALETH